MPYCHKKVLSFLLTTKCNLACKYCYGIRKIEYRTLDFDFAKCAIDEYVKNGIVDRIRFFADGEPTTEPKLMKKIYDYAMSINPDLKSEIQTNGVFNTELAKWLAYHMDEIWISMDLLPDTNDINRVTKNNKPTSPLIEKNLRYFTSLKDKKAMIGVRSTITAQNIDRQKEGIDYFADNFDIKHIWVDPIFVPVEKEGKTIEDIEMMHFAVKFVEAHRYADQKQTFYESNFTTNFDGPTDRNCRSCVPMPHLTTDGYVSACEMASVGAKPDHMDVFIYGKYDKENNKIIYNNDRIRILQSRNLQNLPECRFCIARMHCAGYCPGETQNENMNLFKIKNKICAPLRYIYSEIGNDYDKFKGEFPHKHP